MTQDEIIRMAREADIEVAHMNKPMTDTEVKQAWLERFAALVAENTGIEQQREIVRLKGIIEEQANGAQNLVAAYEREACAKVVNDDRGLSDDDAIRLMRAIRGRGEE